MKVVWMWFPKCEREHAALFHGTVIYSVCCRLNSRLCAGHLPRIFASCMHCLRADKQDIQMAASKILVVSRFACILFTLVTFNEMVAGGQTLRKLNRLPWYQNIWNRNEKPSSSYNCCSPQEWAGCNINFQSFILVMHDPLELTNKTPCNQKWQEHVLWAKPDLQIL